MSQPETFSLEDPIVTLRYEWGMYENHLLFARYCSLAQSRGASSDSRW